MNRNIQKIGSSIVLATLSIFILLATGCRERRTVKSGFFDPTKFDEDDFVTQVTPIYNNKKVDTTKKIFKLDNTIAYAYQANQYFPIWLDEDGNTDYVDALVKDLEGLQNDGLNPERYQLSKLKQALKQFGDSKTPDMNTIITLDTLATHSYLQASRELLMGMVDPDKADGNWHHSNDSAWNPVKLLTRTLYVDGKYPSLNEFRSTVPTYAALIKAKEQYRSLAGNTQLKTAKNSVTSATPDSISTYIIKTEVPSITPLSDSTATTKTEMQKLLMAYQVHYGLKTTGKLDTNTVAALKRQPEEINAMIDANLERIRWMPRSMEQQYILVDVPLMELFLRNDGKDVMHMRVIVGKTDRQTPSLNARMEHVVINPSWGVPPTILKKDVLPGVAKSGSSYLARKDLKVYDRKGREVDPSTVNESNYKSFMFRQPPGDDNALGNIKFNMPNKWDIYLHDTPHRELFGKSERALSSGCVRVQQPREMAEYILTTLNQMNYDQTKLEEQIETQDTKFVTLKNKIPVHIVYLTVFEDGNNQGVRFLKDIYKKDQKLVDAMRSAAPQQAAIARNE